MSAMPIEIANTAVICAVCHDQCVASCPVAQGTHSQAAYPSRLAMTSFGMSLGEYDPGIAVENILTYCIGCNACLDGCVHIDDPNDVTSVVRWARGVLKEANFIPAELSSLLSKVEKFGNPYGNLQERLKSLSNEVQGGMTRGNKSVLLYVDAPTMVHAPEMASSTIRLLRELGYENIAISRALYLGWELWQFGCTEELTRIASNVMKEVDELVPKHLVMVNPSSAFLMKEVYPELIRRQVASHTKTLSEFLVDVGYSARDRREASTALMLTSTERYRLESLEFDKLLGAKRKLDTRKSVSGFVDDSANFPDGELVGLPKSVREVLIERLERSMAMSHASHLVTTSPYAVDALRGQRLPFGVEDIATYLLRRLKKNERSPN